MIDMCSVPPAIDYPPVCLEQRRAGLRVLFEAQRAYVEAHVAKSTRKISQYSGALTPTQVAEGINAAKRNAKRLADDAALLLEAGRFPTALALATLSVEESGKAGILRAVGMATDEAELKRHWKEYRSHKNKNAMWVFVDYYLKGARKLSEFAPMFDESQDHQQVLDELKQLSFYTECVRADKWSEPPIVVEENLAKAIVQIAKLLTAGKDVSAEELEIYFRHMGPVRKSNAAWMQKALINAHAEMQQRGLRSEGPNEAEEFVLGRLFSKPDGQQ